MLRTEDGGRSWYDVSPPVLIDGIGECGVKAYARFEGVRTGWVGYARDSYPDDGYCSPGSIGELWRTEDGGLSWFLSSFVQRNVETFGGDGLGFPLFEFVDSQNGWAWRGFFAGAGSSTYELHRTEDGGRTWRLMPAGYVFRVTGLDFLDRNHGWATTTYPMAYFPPLSLGQTHDAGLSWDYNQVPLPEDLENPDRCAVFAPRMSSPMTGEVTVRCSTLEFGPAWYRYQTGDGGLTWEVHSIPAQPDQHVSASVGWRRRVAPEELQDDSEQPSCNLSWTRDGGRSWFEVGTLACNAKLDFVSDRIGWMLSPVGEDETELLRTTNGGRSWEPVLPMAAKSPAASERPALPRLLPVGEMPAITSLSLADLHLLQEVPASGVTALASYPPRGLLITAHSDGKATFWDPINGGYGRLVRLHDEWIYDAAVAQQASLLATASKDGHLTFWLLYGNVQFEDLANFGGEVSTVAVSSEAALFASAGQDGAVRVWEFEPAGFGSVYPPAVLSAEIRGSQPWVWDVALAPDGSTLASGSSDRTIRIWQVESGELITVLTAHQATVGALAYSPNGSRLASADWDGTVVLWDTESWEPLRVSREHTGRVHSLSFSTDGSLFASGAGDGILMLWSAESGELLAELPAGDAAVRAVLFTPDGQLLIAASDDGLLRLWGADP